MIDLIQASHLNLLLYCLKIVIFRFLPKTIPAVHHCDATCENANCKRAGNKGAKKRGSVFNPRLLSISLTFKTVVLVEALSAHQRGGH